MNPQKNALLIRVDKIGDLVLTLNVDQALPAKEYQATWLINDSLTWITDASEIKRSVVGVPPKFSWAGFFKLLKLIRKLKPQVAITFYAPTWIMFACWIMRIPLRGGRRSRLSSFFLLNRGLRQKRSKSEKHESDYNLDLVKHTLKHAVIEPGPLKLAALKPAIGSAPKELMDLINSKSPFVVIHPGMAGSALNWPTDHYLELCKQACQKRTVVLTGTSSDALILARITEFLEEEIKSGKVIDLSLKLSGHELIYLLSQAAAVVAPSTGVAHLSASLGRPTIGLYSPIKEHLAKRWAPRGAKVVVFEPKKPSAPMSEITVAQISETIDRLS